MRGDLLLARARPLETFGNVAKTVPPEKVDGLRDEALRAAARAAPARPRDDRVPRYVLQLHAEQKHALVVDSRRSRLYVFANAHGPPALLADYYVTLGKNGIEKTREGDQKTPLGVYHVTANLPRKKLTDFYGAGAFPINYPNEWDRRKGRNGHGIWLHGMPSRHLQPPAARERRLHRAHQRRPRVGRAARAGRPHAGDHRGRGRVGRRRGGREAERESLAAAFEHWRADWESRDTERYLAHYSARFALRRAGPRGAGRRTSAR